MLFIKFIAPLIISIPLLITFSIIDITPLIPALTAPPIASPIVVPKLENLSLIVFHNPPKKLPIPLNILVILFHASWNLSLNHPPILPKMFVTLFHAPLKKLSYSIENSCNIIPCLLKHIFKPIPHICKNILNSFPCSAEKTDLIVQVIELDLEILLQLFVGLLLKVPYIFVELL